MTKTCVYCGQQIKDSMARHMRRKGNTLYYFHAYDCTVDGCARLSDNRKLVRRSAVLCKCGEPLINAKISRKLTCPADTNPTYVIPTSCPTCKNSYHLATVLSSMIEGEVTVASPIL
jgi:hypothetical protein